MTKLWISVGLCVVSLAFFSAALAFRVQDQNRIEELARSTNAALCAFKRDLERRYVAGVEFLADHPDGIPGVTKNDIERTLLSQKATLHAIRNLECQ